MSTTVSFQDAAPATPAETTTNKPPFVSVIVPIRNETGYIDGCLNSILQSDWSAEQMEVLVIDGMSTDDTVETVTQIAMQDQRIRLLQNPKMVQTCAMNIGIREAKGSIIIRVDGHAEVSPDFIRRSVNELVERPECWCVGGVVETINDTRIGRIIAASTSCPVGVGNSRFRVGGDAGYADTVPFGGYWKWVFDQIGFFDEELARNEDDELNARLIENGGKIYLNPNIKSRYFSRSSFQKLWKQYYQYGLWRIRTIQKRGSASLRYLVPMCFVMAVIVAVTAAVVSPAMRPFSVAFALMYLTGLLAGAILVARKTGLAGLLISPLVFAILHFSYGLGSLFGIFWFAILGRRTMNHGLSR